MNKPKNVSHSDVQMHNCTQFSSPLCFLMSYVLRKSHSRADIAGSNNRFDTLPDGPYVGLEVHSGEILLHIKFIQFSLISFCPFLLRCIWQDIGWSFFPVNSIYFEEHTFGNNQIMKRTVYCIQGNETAFFVCCCVFVLSFSSEFTHLKSIKW